MGNYDLIHGSADLKIKDGDPRTGKPYIEVRVPAGGQNQLVMHLTCNLAEMIGGAATGARMRWEEQQYQTDNDPSNPRRI